MHCLPSSQRHVDLPQARIGGLVGARSHVCAHRIEPLHLQRAFNTLLQFQHRYVVLMGVNKCC